MRHCGNIGKAGQPAHPAPCPKPRDTWYSTGRVELAGAAKGDDGDITAQAVAKLEGQSTQARRGTRHSIWMYTGAFCQEGESTVMGEFDLVEWYGHSRKRGFTTTHAMCENGHYNSTATKPFTVDPRVFNTWTARYVAGKEVRYRFLAPGRAVERRQHRCVENGNPANGQIPVSLDRCTAVFKGSWKAVVNGDVFGVPPTLRQEAAAEAAEEAAEAEEEAAEADEEAAEAEEEAAAGRNFRQPKRKKPFPTQTLEVKSFTIKSEEAPVLPTARPHDSVTS